ncbi:MAG TPA: glycosyltransferase [Candidatus Dormibacteraeota bacterium]|jgi:trehalose synthase|nr:glycosyltransferase [Candidatus Dormibacteraeota bacterium]
MKEKGPEGKTAVLEKNGKAGESTQERQKKMKVAEKPASQNAGQPATAVSEGRSRQADLPARFIERRMRPRINTQQPPPQAPPRLEDYEAIIGKPELDEIRFLARHLRGKTVKMVNSTAVGGGVAEILNRLIPLLTELEIPTRWDVITGGNDFFEVTKGFHNALQGGEYNLTQQIKDIFMSYSEQNRQRMEFAEDLFVIHDPQPLELVRSKSQKRGKWVWRCHIDLSNPHPGVWDFLKPMVEQYDATIFSAPAFTRQIASPQYLFYPSIDPLSEKNKDLPEEYVNKVCDDFGIDRSRPVITQISRFDRLKDPVGVVESYKLVKKYVDCQLVLAGGGVSDDPEGAVVLQEVMEAASEDPDIIVLNLPPWSALEINALQRASTVIVQKSLKEGFGLTVTEGLWKEKPVVAGAVGGIPTQIVHKLTGVLVHSVEGCAYQIRYLLTHPEFATQLGKNGKEHAKENFLITVNLKRWLLLFQVLLGIAKPNTAL